MIRKHFFLPKEQVGYIREISKSGGISESEVVRRVIERHILEFSPKAASSASKGGVSNG